MIASPNNDEQFGGSSYYLAIEVLLSPTICDWNHEEECGE